MKLYHFILFGITSFLLSEEAPTYVELVKGPTGSLEYASDPSGYGSLFRYRDVSNHETVLKSDQIDPFFSGSNLTATISDQRAIVSGLTGASPIVASLYLGKSAKVDRVLPVLLPSMNKESKSVAFLSWQDRSNTNTQTAVVNIWQIKGNELLTQVVYPWSNAAENNPQPWTGGGEPISLMSPLSWSADGKHLGFVVGQGLDYVYTFVDVLLAEGTAPRVRHSELLLGNIFSDDPKSYVGGIGFRVTDIAWNAGEATLKIAERSYIKATTLSIPVGKDADYHDFKDQKREPDFLKANRLLQFEKTKIDLGQIEKKMHRIDLKYTNTSKKEVSILALARSCSCLTFEEHDLTVHPGEKGSIGVWVDMSEVEGPLLQSVVVLVGSGSDLQSLRLIIKGSSK